MIKIIILVSAIYDVGLYEYNNAYAFINIKNIVFADQISTSKVRLKIIIIHLMLENSQRISIKAIVTCMLEIGLSHTHHFSLRLVMKNE